MAGLRLALVLDGNSIQCYYVRQGSLETLTEVGNTLPSAPRNEKVEWQGILKNWEGSHVPPVGRRKYAPWEVTIEGLKVGKGPDTPFLDNSGNPVYTFSGYGKPFKGDKPVAADSSQFPRPVYKYAASVRSEGGKWIRVDPDIEIEMPTIDQVAFRKKKMVFFFAGVAMAAAAIAAIVIAERKR